MRDINTPHHRIFLLFSGFNPRAVLAIGRLFLDLHIPFFIVAYGKHDPIWKSELRSVVRFSRISPLLDESLMTSVASLLPADCRAVICPTSEFLNLFLLESREFLEEKYELAMPDREIYERLTHKAPFLQWMSAYEAFKQPETLENTPNASDIPFVAKPFVNVRHGKTLYPALVLNGEDFDVFHANCDAGDYFFQEYVEGQSIYFCIYISADGESAGFVQRNLCQQPGGKSIIWAEHAPGCYESESRMLVQALLDIKYTGWVMIECIEREGQLFAIEANPRLWGPLQLAIDVCPRMAELFIEDQVGIEVSISPGKYSEFFWLDGFKSSSSDASEFRWYVQPPKNLASFLDNKKHLDVEYRCG
jgi:hypothetical protein